MEMTVKMHPVVQISKTCFTTDKFLPKT
jgi:hypothetical protein